MFSQIIVPSLVGLWCYSVSMVALVRDCGGWNGAGVDPGWRGREGRSSAFPRPLLAAWRWAELLKVSGPSWSRPPRRFLHSGCRGFRVFGGTVSPLATVSTCHSSHRRVPALRCAPSVIVAEGWSDVVLRGFVHSSSWIHAAVPAPTDILITNWVHSVSHACSHCRFAGLRKISRRTPATGVPVI